MKSSERDERLVDAAERSAEADERAAAAVEAQNRPVRSSEPNPGYPPFRRLFGDERGAVALLRSIPGFAGLWTRVVPDSYVREVEGRERERWSIVSCTCGEQLALRPGAVAECECEVRWFFHAGRSIRVKRFETEAA